MAIVQFHERNWFRHEVDGGWAWLVVAASFTIQMILFGIIQSYGTMYVFLLNEFKSGEYETAWVGSLAYGLMFLTGPLTATLSEHFGCRKMVYVGTGLCMLSCFSSSFASNISTLYFTFGILWGIGGGMTFLPCLLILNFYFAERISLANGITMTGAGLGTLMFNAVLNKIVEVYNWRVGFQLFGGICAVMFVCGSAYRPPPPDFFAIDEWEDYQKVKFTTKLARIVDIRPWKVKAYIVWLIGISFVLFGYFIPYVHLVRFAETLNVPLSQGTLLVGYMSLSQIFAKLIGGRLADTRRIKRLLILVVATLGFGVCNFAVTAAKGYSGLLVYALFFGFFDGLFVVMLPLLIRDLVGRELMANAIGNFYGIMSIPLTLGPPISGQLYDAFKSYTIPFTVAGALMVLSSLVMYVVYRLKPELIKDLPQQQGDDFLTSDLITRPSIHSHTVDFLSGMFLTERFSTFNNNDRPSQFTINPLHNFAHSFSRSRAGSTISGQGRPGARFPSFAFDLRSEGRSEIFLQRLRGNIDGISMGSSVFGRQSNMSTSTPVLTDRFAVSCKNVALDLSKEGVVLASTPKTSSSTLCDQPIDDPAPINKRDAMPKDDVEHVKLPETEETITGDLQPKGRPSEETEKHNHKDDLISIITEKSSSVDVIAQENNQLSIEEHNTNVRDINKIEFTANSSSSEIESPSRDDFPVDTGTPPMNATSSPISQTCANAKTATLISIDTNDEADEITDDISTTLVPDDTETTTETIIPGELGISTGSDDIDEIVIRLPPPPSWNREVLLVDLNEPVDQPTYDIQSTTDKKEVMASGSGKLSNAALTDALVEGNSEEVHDLLNTNQVKEDEALIKFPTPTQVERSYSGEQITGAPTSSVDNIHTSKTNPNVDFGNTQGRDYINPFQTEGFVTHAGHDAANPFTCAEDVDQEYPVDSPSALTRDNSNENNGINVPVTSDISRYRKTSLVLDDNPECHQSSNNSLVKVFEMELDETIKDEHDAENDPADDQIEESTSAYPQDNVTSSTNPFSMEIENSLKDSHDSIPP